MSGQTVATDSNGNDFTALVDLLCSRYKQTDAATVVVIAGAGASFTSGMPRWGDLREKILRTAESCFTLSCSTAFSLVSSLRSAWPAIKTGGPGSA